VTSRSGWKNPKHWHLSVLRHRKSSLLRIIAGTEKDFEGTVQVRGKIAMMFQEPTLLSWRNVRDNITTPTGVDTHTAEGV